MNNTIRTPACQCPKCDCTIDAATSADNTQSVPEEGDVSVCINCASMLIFKEDMTMRLMSKDEFMNLPQDITIMLVKMVSKVTMQKFSAFD